MPVFALANTNIRFEQGMVDGLIGKLGLGIIPGLLIGKPLGIFVTSWIVVKLKLAILPNKANWSHLLGLGLLGDIGFTMSILSRFCPLAILYFKQNQNLLSLFPRLFQEYAGICFYLILSVERLSKGRRDAMNRFTKNIFEIYKRLQEYDAFLLKKKPSNRYQSRLEGSVVWAGIEPATQGFSVLCSTD